ncbi:MAG: nuclear transport factor 2 family protein [Planctomycetota bacterium]
MTDETKGEGRFPEAFGRDAITRLVQELFTGWRDRIHVNGSPSPPLDAVRLVQRFWEAYLTADDATARAALADDVRIEFVIRPGAEPDRAGDGPDGALARLDAHFSALTEVATSIGSVDVSDDTVAFRGRERGVVRATGRAYDVAFSHRYTLASDRIATLTIGLLSDGDADSFARACDTDGPS